MDRKLYTCLVFAWCSLTSTVVAMNRASGGKKATASATSHKRTSQSAKRASCSPTDLLELPIENGSLTFKKVRSATLDKALLEQHRDQIVSFYDDHLEAILTTAEAVREEDTPSMRSIENALAWILFIHECHVASEAMDTEWKQRSDEILKWHTQLITDTSNPTEDSPSKEELQNGVRACTILLNMEQKKSQIAALRKRRKRLQSVLDKITAGSPADEKRQEILAVQRNVAEAISLKQLTYSAGEEAIRTITPESSLLTFCKQQQQTIFTYARELEKDLKAKEPVELSTIESCLAGLKLVERRVDEGKAFEFYEIENSIRSLGEPVLNAALEKARSSEATEKELAEGIRACAIAIHDLFLIVDIPKEKLKAELEAFSTRLKKAAESRTQTPSEDSNTNKKPEGVAGINGNQHIPTNGPADQHKPQKKSLLRTALRWVAPITITALVAFVLYKQYDKKKALPKTVT